METPTKEEKKTDPLVEKLVEVAKNKSQTDPQILETNIGQIVNALQDEFGRELSPKLVAYAMATVEHDTQNLPETTSAPPTTTNEHVPTHRRLIKPPGRLRMLAAAVGVIGSIAAGRIKEANAYPSSSPTAVEQVVKVADNVSATNEQTLQINVSDIFSNLDAQGIGSPRVKAYAAATTELETGYTFQPIKEWGGRQQAIKLGYSGGTEYFGRGYIQLTHIENYQSMDKRLGLGGQLVANPDLALQPNIAARILAAFFKDRGVAQLAESSFYAARKPVNGSGAAEVAQKAEVYLAAITGGGTPITQETTHSYREQRKSETTQEKESVHKYTYGKTEQTPQSTITPGGTGKG